MMLHPECGERFDVISLAHVEHRSKCHRKGQRKEKGGQRCNHCHHPSCNSVVQNAKTVESPLSAECRISTLTGLMFTLCSHLDHLSIA